MLLTPTQAAEKLGVHKETILRHIRKGDIKAVRLGPQTIRIDPKELEAFTESENKEAVG